MKLFLDLMDEAGEERILTGQFRVGTYFWKEGEGCLVGLGVGWTASDEDVRHCAGDLLCHLQTTYPGIRGIESEFDRSYQLDSLGTAAAIYAHIRANRAKRAGPPDTLAEIVPEPIRDLIPA